MRTSSSDQPDTHTMVVGHRVFRREFRLLPALIQAVRAGDGARARLLAEHGDDVATALHRHHISEDEVLWPRLLDRAPVHAAVVHRMERQHEQVAEHLQQIAALLPTWKKDAHLETRDELANEFASAAVILDEHLDEEEREILPLVAEHITAAEWSQLGQRAHAGMPHHKLLKLMGMVFEDANTHERAQMLAALPGPGRLVWNLVGRRSYQKLVRELRGTAA